MRAGRLAVTSTFEKRWGWRRWHKVRLISIGQDRPSEELFSIKSVSEAVSHFVLTWGRLGTACLSKFPVFHCTIADHHPTSRTAKRRINERGTPQKYVHTFSRSEYIGPIMAASLADTTVRASLLFGALMPPLYFTVKTKHPFSEYYTCFGCETKTGVVRFLTIFQHRHMFSPINGKLSPRPFEWYGWT